MNGFLKYNLLFILLSLSLIVFSQNKHKGIHQEQSEYFGALLDSGVDFASINQPATMQQSKSTRSCNLDKLVFGWHPFWMNGVEGNYDWNLLSDFSYFSYEVNPNTGAAYTTHNFATAPAVTSALSNGVRVNLCVTLFNDHATFFNSAASKQTLINNLITLIQNRNAHGVNIDFESMNSTLSADYTNFIVDLSTQMKAAIPNCQISLALHAVDWSGFYDIPALEPHVDLFCIMGYDYYWQGSTQAGPNDPLYHFGTTYNYTLSRSVTYYEAQGAPKSKIILGLPYYGREWDVQSHTLPANTTANGNAVFYNTVKQNNSGNYAQANRNIEPESRSVYYNYFDAGTPRQCFISEEEELGERMDFLRKRGLAGMGIWALGYDDGYSLLWDEIESNLTDCATDPCSGTIWDMGGGPHKNYYNNEDYTFTIAPAGANEINVDFTSFETELNFDFLYIYDGNDQNAPEIAGSPFSGTNSPGSFTTSGGSVTFRFVSDGANVAPGFQANYTCEVDNIPPTTSINYSGNWQTDDFQVNFTDEDNPNGSGIDRRFYHVGHYDGSAWRANANRGFFADYFEFSTIHSDWTSQTGTWSIQNNTLIQTDETLGNTNIYAPLEQSLSNLHLYHFKQKIDGTGSNKRAGFHFFCDVPTAVNRENSYFIWLRADDDMIQFYKVTNDNFGAPVINQPYTINEGEWYDVKVTYDRIDGDVALYINNEFVASWVDPDPILTGDYISFRSGDAQLEIDSLTVYRTRYPTVNVGVGSTNDKDIQYQNFPVSQQGGRIVSIVRDQAHNLSSIVSSLVNVDWTPPIIDYVNDGLAADIDTLYDTSPTNASSNWEAQDENSAIQSYSYAIGTSPYSDDIFPWTPNGTQEAVSLTNVDMDFDVWYYFNVRTENGAGLIDSLYSNGFRILASLNTSTYSLKDVPKVYPNPTSNQLYIDWSKSLDRLEIYDMKGAIVKKSSTHLIQQGLSVTDLNAGSYIIRLYGDNEVYEFRFVKK